MRGFKAKWIIGLVSPLLLEFLVTTSYRQAVGQMRLVGGASLGLPRTSFIESNYLYVGAGMCLAIFDISDPRAPILKSQFYTPYSIRRIYAKYPYVYLLHVFKAFAWLRVINVAEPTRPEEVGLCQMPLDSYPIDLWQLDLQVLGNYAYVSLGRNGVRIINLSNPNRPIEVGRYHPSGPTTAISLTEGLAYVLVENQGLVILDISDSVSPVQQVLYPIEGTPVDLCISKRQAYVSVFESADSCTLLILDIVDLNDIRTLARHSFPRSYHNPLEAIQSLQENRGLLYFTELLRGLFVVNVSDPSHPRQVSHLPLPNAAFHVNVLDSTAYVCADEGGLIAIDLVNPSSPRSFWQWSIPQVLGMEAVGKYLLVAEGYKGIQVFDISQPAAPQSLGSWQGDATGGFDVGFDFQDLCHSGDLLYVLDHNGTIYTFDVSHLPYLDKIGRYDSDDDWILSMDASGGYLYMVGVKFELIPVPKFIFTFHIIDFSNPSVPEERGKAEIEGKFDGAIRVQGSFAYIGTEDKGLKIFDVSDPTAPREVGSYGEGENIALTFLKGSYAYVSIQGEKLLILDITDPVHPQPLGEFSHKGFLRIGGTYIANDHACFNLISQTASFLINRTIAVDVSNPSDIKEVDHFDTDDINVEGYPTRNIYAQGNYFYVSQYYLGLLIFEVTSRSGVKGLELPSVTQEALLLQNHPNPFNTTTTISYRLPKTSKVSLKIYNLLGQVVRTLVDTHQEPGTHTADWDGRDDRGRELPSGVYLYRLEVGGTNDERSFVETRKMLLIR